MLAMKGLLAFPIGTQFQGWGVGGAGGRGAPRGVGMEGPFCFPLGTRVGGGGGGGGGGQGAAEISSAAGGQRDFVVAGGGGWSCHAVKDQVAQKWPK